MFFTSCLSIERISLVDDVVTLKVNFSFFLIKVNILHLPIVFLGHF